MKWSLGAQEMIVRRAMQPATLRALRVIESAKSHRELVTGTAAEFELLKDLTGREVTSLECLATYRLFSCPPSGSLLLCPVEALLLCPREAPSPSAYAGIGTHESEAFSWKR
jgi:hypothetical protein